MKQWFLMIGLILGIGALTMAQEVEVSAKVQDEHVAVGKPFTLDLSMKVPYGSYVEWNPFVADTLSAQIDILKRGDFRIRPAHPGAHRLHHGTYDIKRFRGGQVLANARSCRGAREGR